MYTLAIVKYFCLNTIDLPQKKINDDIYLIRDYRHRGNLASFFARVYNRADKLSMTFCGKKDAAKRARRQLFYKKSPQAI